MTKKKARGRRSSSRLIFLRADSSKQVRVNDRFTPVKMASLISRDRFKNEDRSYSALSEQLKKEFAAIPGNRPIESITQFSASGSPEQIITPGKTLLNRTSKNGVFYIFSNVDRPKEKPIVQVVGEDFKSTPSYQAIQSTTLAFKTQVITITPQLLRNRDARSSQNQVMVESGVDKALGSSTEYARSAELISQGQYAEWLHLVAHSFIGKKGQHQGNLVSGTNHANTDMMFVESLVRDFSKVSPQGFKLEVTADMIEGTHFAKTIDYKITTKDFCIDFSFNAQSEIKPHVLYQDYVSALGKVLVKKDEESTEAKNVTNASHKGLCFFDKISQADTVAVSASSSSAPDSVNESNAISALGQLLEKLVGPRR